MSPALGDGIGPADHEPAGSSRWIVTPRPGADARLRLICLPYCGGAVSVFNGWAERLPDSVEAWLVQLPGRGARFGEPPYTAMRLLAGDLASSLAPRLSAPYALFGHSLGALVSFELARELRRRAAPPPVRLFVSACGAPHTRGSSRDIHDLPDQALLDELARLNGTPARVLAEPDLMRALLPTIRADFRLFETYSYAEEAPLDCPITVFGGSDDSRVSRDRLEAWSAHGNGELSLRMFPGGHFFIHEARDRLVRAIAEDLGTLD